MQMHSLLATGQARKRQDAAASLGVHRTTVGRWLARYAAGGLEALLAIRAAPGKPRSLPPAALAAVEQALHQPAGFASYEAVRQWLRATHQIDIKDKTRYAIVRTRFKVKRNVPRPSHQKNPDALTAFQRACGALRAAVIPADDPRPIRVFSQDERRFGLLTIRRRRLTARGVQPVGIVQYGFQSFYLSGAVAPTSGERFFQERLALNAGQFQRFLDAFSQAFANRLTILALDKSSAHTAGD